MPAPAMPDVMIERVAPGDRLLLSSDGLYGMVDDPRIKTLLRSSRNPKRVCQRLIDEANANGGKDNIAAVYVQITR
jgi:protein phosphatase